MCAIALTISNAYSFNTNTELTNTPADKKVKRIYYWEVVTDYGVAKGTSVSIEKAEQMVKLMTTNDVYSYTIIQGGQLLKH